MTFDDILYKIKELLTECNGFHKKIIEFLMEYVYVRFREAQIHYIIVFAVRLFLLHWFYFHANDRHTKLHSHACSRTGCLLTADGSEDAVVKPQGIVYYVVPA